MKIKTNSLIKFIEDFKLEGKNGTICFDAIILMTTLKSQIQLPSEVHIIHLSAMGVDVIYLLDPDVIKHQIPERFDNSSTIEYRLSEYLYIKGHSPVFGNYILSIHPTNTNCEPSTLKELYQKTYN